MAPPAPFGTAPTSVPTPAEELLPQTGTRRGPAWHGESVHDAERDALRLKLEEFEARADPDDPDQMALLAEMREHTQQVERLNGTWNRRGKPGVSRDANEYNPPEKTRRPDDLDDYRAYKEHAAREREFAANLRQSQGRAALSNEAKEKQREESRRQYLRERGLVADDEYVSNRGRSTFGSA